MSIAASSIFRFSTGLAFLFTLSIAGCATGGAWDVGRAEHDADLPSANDSYVVLGVQPENAQVSLFKGSVSSGYFLPDQFLPGSFVGRPEDGFIVTRSRAADILAITYVKMVGTAKDVFHPPLIPCGGAKTLVVTAPAGKVIYLGTVHYEFAGTRAFPRFDNDFGAAKAFMTTHYPKLAGSLEQGHYEMMPAANLGNCGGS